MHYHDHYGHDHDGGETPHNHDEVAEIVVVVEEEIIEDEEDHHEEDHEEEEGGDGARPIEPTNEAPEDDNRDHEHHETEAQRRNRHR